MQQQITITLDLSEVRDAARQLNVSANQYLALSKHFGSNVSAAYLSEANACRLLAARLEAAIAMQS
jgi:hypothetical protein